MSDESENLKIRRAAVCAELAALNTSNPGGKPNISGGSGTVDHIGYKRSLYEELGMIDQRLSAIEGPWEIPIETRLV
jgi:hypothetical protein